MHFGPGVLPHPNTAKMSFPKISVKKALLVAQIRTQTGGSNTATVNQMTNNNLSTVTQMGFGNSIMVTQ